MAGLRGVRLSCGYVSLCYAMQQCCGQSAGVVRCSGKGESESGPAARRLRDGNVPSVCVRDLSHECQPDAVARAIPGGSVGLSMREAVEQRFDGAWVDAHAVVTHIDEDVVMVPS